MQRVAEGPLEQLRELLPVRRAARSPREVLKQLAPLYSSRRTIDPTRRVILLNPFRVATAVRTPNRAPATPLSTRSSISDTPVRGSSGNTREKIAANANVNAKPMTTPTVMMACRTATYRALRRSRTGISMTWCLTTAYANDSGSRKSAMSEPTHTQNGNSMYSMPAPAEIDPRITTGRIAPAVPHSITRVRRLVSGRPRNAFHASEPRPSPYPITECTPMAKVTHVNAAGRRPPGRR